MIKLAGQLMRPTVDLPMKNFQEEPRLLSRGLFLDYTDRFTRHSKLDGSIFSDS